MAASVAGSIRIPVELGQLPRPGGFAAVMAGETWHFQAWHRDAVGGSATSNFTNGLQVQFVN